MAVYEGVLEKVSEGFVRAGGRGGENGWGTREFIEIGGEHLRNVHLLNYHASLLRDAVGEVAAVSIAGRSRPGGAKRKTVVALRTPKLGVVRPGLPLLLAAVIWGTLRAWIGGLFLGGIVLAIGVGTSFTPLTVVGVALIAFFVLRPIVTAVTMLKAWGALSGRPAVTSAEAGQVVQSGPVAATSDAKTCPQCAENVKRAAVACRFCGHRFDALGFST